MKSHNIQKDANKPQNNQNYIQKNIPLRNEPKPTLQNVQHHLGKPESNTLNKPSIFTIAKLSFINSYVE